MPDLERSSVLDWLRQTEPRIAARVASPIRSIEDAQEVRALLMDLGLALDAGSPDRVGRGLAKDDARVAREIIAQLGVARMLRLLEWIDGATAPEAAAILRIALLQDDTSEAGRALRSTLDVLHRQDLLARIFAPDRLEALIGASTEPAKEAA